MQTQHIILFVTVMMLVIAFNQSPARAKPRWWQHLKGWQKVIGLVAFVGVLLIMINPEFLALGLLGDTAFFDMLVLALSLQMHTFVIRTFRWCVTVLARGVRYVGIPSPGLRYLLAISTLAIGNAAAIVRKAPRIFSSHAMA